jgi:hypothetical protein
VTLRQLALTIISPLLLLSCSRAQLGSNAIHAFLLAHAAEIQQAQQSIPDRLPGESKPRLSPAEAQAAFHAVDEILKWVSNDTGLPITGQVNRDLATRAEMERYNADEMRRDGGAEEMRRSELVLKKFGLLPRDFELESFLMKLLREQVVAFYAPEKKTVFLLDWVDPASLRPVLAHELTHALQDQAIDIDKWIKPENSAGDHQDSTAAEAEDERDAARRAVLEGQGMITMLDFVEEPRGRNALSAVGDAQQIIDQMGSGKDSPIFRAAPLYIRETMAFPYRYGMQFERAMLGHGGRKLAFEGVLQDPPANAREIMEPRSYLQHERVAPIPIPDLAGITKDQFERVAAGPIGAFDVHTLAMQFSKTSVADRIAREWRGGYYIAMREAQHEHDPLGPAELKLIYVSHWSSAKAAEQFFDVYAHSILERYAGAKLQSDAAASTEEHSSEWQTSEGPVLIHRVGDAIVVCESFPLETAKRIREAAFAALKSSPDIAVR